MQLMTQAEYARHRGVGKSAVSNWKAAGLIVLAEDDAGRVKVDVVRTDARINARIDPLRGRPANGASSVPVEPAPAAQQVSDPTASGSGTVSSERMELMREQRVGVALKNAQMAKELVPAIEAERRLSEASRLLRERLHAEFRGSAERQVAIRDRREMMIFNEEVIDRVFGDVADMIETGLLASDDDEGDPDSAAQAA